MNRFFILELENEEGVAENVITGDLEEAIEAGGFDVASVKEQVNGDNLSQAVSQLE